MIIGVDIRVLGNNVKSGIEEYTENLLSHLLPLGLENNISFKLFFSSFKKSLLEYPWSNLPNVEIHKFKMPNKLISLSARTINNFKIDKEMGGVDVFFSPHFFLVPLSESCKRVVTFHDLSYERFPEFFSWRKNIWHNFEMRPKWQSNFSDGIIAVSESTKNDLVKLYGVDPSKIEVIYSGISSLIKRLPDNQIEIFRRENKLPDNYILFLGKLEPRKNIVGLIKAFNLLKRSVEFGNLYLVIVGARGWLEEEIFKEAEKSKFKDKIIFNDHIQDELRSGYYSCARVFAYPSFFEGFGFPPLEALVCNLPVVISNVASLPELGGFKEGISLVDPYNVSDIAKVLEIALIDNEKKEGIRKEIKSTRSVFNWDDTAKKTLAYLLK